MSCEIVFLDVGQGDSIIITPGSDVASAIVIDVPKPRRVSAWLRDHDKLAIDCVYFTHDHRDHMPALRRLPQFLSDWSRLGKIRRICLPTELLRKAILFVEKGDPGDPEVAIVRSALESLDAWFKANSRPRIEFVRGEYSGAPHVYGEIEIEVMHPHLLYSELHQLESADEVNETSLVLRVKHGEFKLLSLADIEEDGLHHLVERCESEQLACQVVKVPHHGAWHPNSNDDYRKLFAAANPELAVLSVGSRNPHKHVVPELFQFLLELCSDPTTHLEYYVCTEATRTCVFSFAERSTMEKRGLPAVLPCAGDVVILAELSGRWQMERRQEHLQVIDSIPYAACFGRADFAGSPERASAQ